MSSISSDNRSMHVESSSFYVSVSTNLGTIENIQRAIQQKDYLEAINDIALLCNLPELDLQTIEKIYFLLKDLLPFLDREAFCSLQKNIIQNLLNLSFDLPGFQKDLSVQLGNWHVEKAEDLSPDRLDSYLQAMHYYAKALEIVKKHNLEEMAVHCLASQLFMKSVQEYAIDSERIKDQLEKASGYPERFKEILKHFEDFLKYRTRDEDNDTIRILYKQARDVFLKTNENPKKLLRPFLPEIESGSVREFPPLGQFITIVYRTKIHQFREFLQMNFQQVLYPTNFQHVHVFQKSVAEKLKKFFRELLSDAFTILGKPPCECDLRAMGSFGREEVCPYSDLEWMILIEEIEDTETAQKAIEYFKTLAKFIEIQVVSLGETAPANLPVFTCLGEKHPSGFHIDSGGNPARDDLICTPQKMAFLQEPINQDEGYDPGSVEHTSLKTISLYQTTTELFENYQRNIEKILNRRLSEKEKTKIAKTVRERRAFKLIEKRFKDYQKFWRVPFEEEQVINIKKQYVETLQHLLSDLALFYGIKKTNTLEIIDELRTKQVFTEESAQLLKEAIAFIYMMRVRLHLEYKEQKEEAAIQSQNDLHLYYFSSQEKGKFAEIYWLVIRPLFFYMKKVVWGELKEPLKNISLLKIALEEVLWCNEKSKISRFLSFITYFVRFSVRTKKPLEVHRYCYERFSEKLILEPLRIRYLETLRKKGKHDIAKELSFIPNREGLRISHIEANKRLLEVFYQITTLDEPSSVVVKSATLQISRYLKRKFIKELLDEQGYIKREYTSSLHRVCRLKVDVEGIDLHFKQEPSHALMEYAIHDLHSRLTGEETPSTELLSFEVTIQGKRKIYPVLVSQSIPGKNLREVLVKNRDYVPNAKCFTRMLLNVICTRPGDGRASNFIAQEDQLVCIDNDIAFVEPIVKEKGNPIVNFCSILFCLRYQNLDSEILQEFAKIDADLIFNAWLKNIAQKEQLYDSLFSQEKKRQLYENDKENPCVSTLLLRAGTITTLYTQVRILQEFLLKDPNEKVFPINLFERLITLRGEDGQTSQIGGRVVERYQQANRTKRSPSERLKEATGRKKEQSMTSKQALKVSLGRIPTIEEIQEREDFSLEKVKEEFMGYSLFMREGCVILKEKQGKETLEVNFEKIIKRGNPDYERQNLMIRGLELIFSRKKPVSVTLTYCAVLNNSNIASFLHKDLTYLDLRYTSIKADVIETINKECPRLKELYLSGCYQLQAMEIWGRVSSAFLNFWELQVLHIARCETLKRVKINAPKLRELRANDNSQLNNTINETIKLCGSGLEELYLSGCPNLSVLSIEEGLSLRNLKKLHVGRCKRLSSIKITAPKLQELNADNNPQLKKADLRISPLVELNTTKSPFLGKITGIAFGKKAWEKYFGDVGEEPPLPEDIIEILNDLCTFWPDKEVRDTHLLMLVPEIVNGRPYTLNYLEELIRKPKTGYATKYRHYASKVKEELGEKSYPSHWVLMTRDVVPKSRNKSYLEQCQLMSDHGRKTGLPYELPLTLDAATCILMEYVQTGQRLYGTNPLVFTRCQEKVENNRWPVAIGGFDVDGLYVNYYNYDDNFDGVAGLCNLRQRVTVRIFDADRWSATIGNFENKK